MWLSKQHAMLTELIESTLVQLCTENVPYESQLDLDGIICINSDASGAKQLVVKIHKKIGPPAASSEADKIAKCAPKVVPVQFSLEPFCLAPNSTPVEIIELAPINGIHRSLAARTINENVLVMPQQSRESQVGKSCDGQMQAWKQRAPQILKLLTKTELSPANRGQLLQPTDLSRSATNGNKPSAPAIAKKEVHDDKVEDLTIGTLHSGNRWRCKICHIQCNSFNELELHMRSEHVRFVCRLCLNSFTLSCNLRRHMKLHAGVRPHICSHCSATFSRSTDLKIHMKKHLDVRSERGKDEASSTVLETSTNNFHSPSTKSTILHECDICNKGFAIAAHLAEHRQNHGILTVKHENTDITDSAADMSEGDRTADSEGISDEQCTSDVDNQTLDLSNAVTHDVSADAENAMDYTVDLSVKIPTCVTDLDSTMRDFAPLFNLSDTSSTDQQSINGGSVNCSTPSNTVSVSVLPARSKRKGLPVKRVDTNSDDNDEFSADDSGTVVQDTLCVSDEAVNKESTPSQSLPEICSPTQSTTNEESETNGQSSEDLDLKIYNCQYTGGCNTSWCGFAAYEQHYTSAHGGRYPCHLCAQSFTSRNNRRRHADGHTGSPGSSRHHCSTCGKHFARADISKEHRLTHTRSYHHGVCVKCGDTGGNKRSSLLLHLKRCLAHVDIDKDIDDADSTTVV